LKNAILLLYLLDPYKIIKQNEQHGDKSTQNNPYNRDTDIIKSESLGEDQYYVEKQGG